MFIQNARKRTLTIAWLIILLISLILAVNDSHATQKDLQLSPKQPDAQNALSIDTLNDINDSIKLQSEEVNVKIALLKKAKTDQEKIKLQAEIDDVSRSIDAQASSFEMIITGGQALAKKDTTEEKEFDWQKDLLEILQPIISELRQLTEHKRKMDSLQKNIVNYESQNQEIDIALSHIARINKEKLEEDTLKKFEQINKKWQDKLEENNHLLSVTRLQLDEMIRSEEANKISFDEHAKQFATGRGATIFIALVAFIAVYIAMSLIWKGVIWVNVRKPSEKWRYYQRIVTLTYHVMMILLAITAVFYVLSVRNDQALIAIAVLLLVSIIWVLKNSIPRYIDELKILLNTGAVREGECIIYNGIPMKITSLNFDTELINPAVPTLKLRLPLSEISNYISRPYTTDEPWFPCKVGDYVRLSDGKYGLVKNITLENVLVTLYNGMMPKTYTMSDFLSSQPKNLSQGFIVTSTIGVDYKYQQQCTAQMPEILCEGIRKGLQQESSGASLKDIWVYFSQANTSSLDFKIVAIFDGKAAEDYYPIVRSLQRYAVEVCNQQQWEIPFTQIVLHNNPNQ